MVKVSVLIGAILTTVGMILQFIIFGKVFRASSTAGIVLNNNIISYQNGNDLSYQELMWYLSLNAANHGLITAFIVIPIVIFGMILILLPSFKIKKPIWIIGSLLYIVGLILQLVVFWTNMQYSTFSDIAEIIIFAGIVLYFVGLITIRSYYKLGIVMGIFLVIIGFVLYIIFGGIVFRFDPTESYSQSELLGLEKWFNILLILQCVFTAVNALNGWFFTFSKKGDASEDGAEDTMSIANGNAFETFIEPEKKKEKKKAEKSDKVEFTF